MSDDAMVKVMSSLGLDYSPAINSTLQFQKTIGDLNKQLGNMKSIAIQGAKDINTIFSSQLGNSNNKAILDQWCIPIKTIREEAKAATQPISEMNNAIHNVGETVQDTGNKFTSNAAKFYAFVKAGKQATNTIKDVEMGMVEIARVMEDSTFVFDRYRDSLFSLGIEYGQTFDNAQNIALRWAQSGYNVADSLKLTETSLLALNAAELDATNATESMIGIMSQWNLEAEDLGIVMDKINKTADTHAATSQDLVDGLLRSSGAARTMNLSLEETLALLVNMREASGRTGKEAGNALNSIISYMQRPSAIKAIEGAGISMFADLAKTEFRNIMDIFGEMSASWNAVGDDLSKGFLESADSAEFFNEELAISLGLQEEWNDLQKRDVSQAAAGVHRRNFLIGLMERMGNTQKALNGMMDAEGYSMQKNADTMETLDKKQQSLKTSMDALAVAMGDAGLGGSLKTLAVGGTDALNMMNSLPKGAKDAVLGFTNVFLTVKALDSGMKLFGANIPVVNTGLKILTGGIANAATNTMAFGTALKTAFVANAPLMGVAALAGGLIALVNHMKKVREEAERYIETTSQNIQSLGEEKQGLEELSKEYETLKDKQRNLIATADDKTRLIEIQKELVELYDVSIIGIDSEGQAYADSTNAIQQRIKALEELKEIEEANLETAVMARDVDDVKNLEENIRKQEELGNKLIAIQKKIKDFTSSYTSGGNLDIGGTQITPQHFKYDEKAKAYIQSLSQEKLLIENGINDVNDAIEKGTTNKEQLLMADATKIANQLTENGVVVSDSARAYATELVKGLSQAPKDIFTLKDELETAIRDFTSSDFEKWSENYKKAISDNDTKGIDEASAKINELVHGFVDGEPKLKNFALAMESAFADSNSIKGATTATFDLKTAMQSMGDTAKKAFTDLKTLNQAIYDVKNGQALSADAVLDLVEKYGLNTDAIKETTKGYTVEISALENLRSAKIQTANDGMRAEMDQANATKTYVESRIKNYGLEIEQLGNLASARVALQRSADASARAKADLATKTFDPLGIMGGNDPNKYAKIYKQYYDEESASISSDLETYDNAVKFLDEAEKRSKMLEGMLNNKSYGVSESKSKKPKKEKYENKQLEEALKLLEHRKRISEETQKSIQTEINDLNRINKAYVKTANERMNMAERIYSAEKRLRDRTLQDSTNWINEKKNLNELSVEEEIAGWERIRNNQSNNIEAQKQTTLNLYKLKEQLRLGDFNKEENTIKHLTKLGIYGVQEQIDAYRKLYTVKADSLEDERNRVENLFSLYKSLLSDQQKTIKSAYDDRIKQIESETKAKKEAQDDIIKGIEKELELLNKQENEYDHDKKMADLREQLAYWEVRTSEDARKKVIDLKKQIDEAEHKREIELKKQGLEDKKKVLQDEARAFDDTAREEREKAEKSYKLIEVAFDNHSMDMIALASTMSKEMFDQVQNNYLIPLQQALADGNYGSVGGILDGFDDFAQGAYDKTYNSNNTQVNRLANNIVDLKKQYEYGNDKSAQKKAVSLYDELSSISPNVADSLHGMDYMSAQKYVKGLPKMHDGGKSLSYGAVEMMPGELTFPPDLSIKLEGLIGALYQRPTSQSPTSNMTDKRVVNNFHSPLFNSEKTVFEDDTDERSFSRELQRAIASMA